MVNIFPMSSADHGEVVHLLARAFAEDPHFAGLLPADDVERRRRDLFGYVAVRANHSPETCDIAVDDAGTIIGAALWEHPDVLRPHQRPIRATVEHLTTLPLLHRIFGVRLSDANRTQAAVDAARPAEAHWYLKIIGTAPEARGMGAGKALLNHRLTEADRYRAPAYLESSAPENVPYYERFGFRLRGEVPSTGTVNTYGMWRLARND